MPNIRTMMGGKYLKKEDVAQPVLVSIAGIEQQNIKLDDASELKWVMHFAELDKPMVLNSTNMQLCAQACGSEETDDWIGKKVVLFTDPNVSMQGKLVGGLRIRAMRKPAIITPKPPPPIATLVDDEDIPF